MEKEGEIPFDVPKAGKPCHTWFKVVGDLKSRSCPLIVIHGGPGVGHECLLPLGDLHERLAKPVIFYDQLGCGNSTRLRDKAGDESFWIEELFRAELDNLIDYFNLRQGEFDVLGHSWGGMLASKWAALHPKGLRKLILADAPSSVELLLIGENALRLKLPKDVQEVLNKCEKEGRIDSEEYEQACLVFYKRHLCRIDPMPKEVETGLWHLKEDPTVYTTMFGPSELMARGNLKDWSAIQEAKDISVQVLLINGRYDEIQDVAVMPFFEHIPRVKWITLENSSHMGQFEERERYMEIVEQFLRLILHPTFQAI